MARLFRTPSVFAGWARKPNSPYINRFLSADTVLPRYSNPQDLNRFGHVLNNPIRYTDPTGNRACGDGEDIDCSGHKQDPNQNPHLPKPKPHKDRDKDKKPEMCSTSPQGCILGGALLIAVTDLTVGIPAFVVIVFSGGVTPPAVAAEVLETVVVLPINIFGLILIKKGADAQRNNP